MRSEILLKIQLRNLESYIGYIMVIGCLCLSPHQANCSEKSLYETDAGESLYRSSNRNINLPRGTGPGSSDLKQASNEPENWLYHTRDYTGTRYSPLNRINRTNVADLQVVCLHQLGNDAYFQAGPLVFNGIMYLTAGARTVAINADDCRSRWSYTWEHRDRRLGKTNRGVAIQDGYVVRGTSDGYLIALDSYDGSLLWAEQIAKPSEGERFTMAPMIFEDAVLIGPAGGEYGISGWIGAYRLRDGKQLWRFNTVPGATDIKDKSWSNPLGIRIGGGAVWTPMSLDPGSEELFVAVTNPAPAFPADLRPGNNLYTNSVISLNVKTGKLNWYKQLIPNDDRDWDLTQVSPLFTAQIDNDRKDLIATAGKDGFLRTIDRDTGEIIYQTAVTTQHNADAPVTINGTYTCPGISGGVLWNGPALDPNRNLLITPSVNLCSTYYRAKEIRYIAGKDYYGGTVISDPNTMAGWVTATDINTGKIIWQKKTTLPMIAAITTTAGGLVLTGELTGDFLVLDAANGEDLYRFNTGGAVGGGIVSYEVNGKQFIAVASGSPSITQVNGSMGSPTVLVFSLPD